MHVGIDIGSRTIKIASLRDGVLRDYQVVESGFDPQRQALELIRQYQPSKIVATGYGRHLTEKYFSGDVITEIKAHALGARFFFPDCRTVLDVGGQDSKVISLDQRGKITGFQMNDKCAAGTGRFLEIMAISLGVPLAEFGNLALQASQCIKVNSMCTVFAESEVISLKNQGAAPWDIARAAHLSVVERLAAMLQRIGCSDSIVFTGGVARNTAIVHLLREQLNREMRVPEIPDVVGALGAAIHASETVGNDRFC